MLFLLQLKYKQNKNVDCQPKGGSVNGDVAFTGGQYD